MGVDKSRHAADLAIGASSRQACHQCNGEVAISESASSIGDQSASVVRKSSGRELPDNTDPIGVNTSVEREFDQVGPEQIVCEQLTAQVSTDTGTDARCGVSSTCSSILDYESTGASPGIKRPASPSFKCSDDIRKSYTLRTLHPSRRNLVYPPARPSAWRPSDNGGLQRYPLSAVDQQARLIPDHRAHEPSLRSKTTPLHVPPVCNLLSEPVMQPGFEHASAHERHPAPTQGLEYDMVKQLPRSFITQDQLAAEVKGIYAGLVMIEAKSINIDAEQAADRKKQLTSSEWQSLIALRRTLLYEHHDFLMATQHPTANTVLRGLAAKYCMPARMWKHGIHEFLEVLRHRRPESQEYMLTFIYLAYDMMALLYETVPAFTDTWIECLGDLARYRMAIEEDKEIHAIWGGVAGRWYTMAADRHPQIGRLYHHLGILETPSLRKFYYYSRSLTSVVPFTNARKSLGTLCAPILLDNQAIRCGPHGAEAMTICYHARAFSQFQPDLLERDGLDALDLLKAQPADKTASYAAALAITNIASLFEYGMPNNIFRQTFAAELARAAHNARPSTLTPVTFSEAARLAAESEAFVKTTAPTEFVLDFMTLCFNRLINRDLTDKNTVYDLLQYFHVHLVFFSALLDLRTGLTSSKHVQMVDKLINAVEWDNVVNFLNTLETMDPISERAERSAESNEFLLPEKIEEREPLAEDYMMRGLIWAEGYVAEELFQNSGSHDDLRYTETPTRLHLRAQRVAWLACCIAQPEKQAPIVYHRKYGFKAQEWPGTFRSAETAPRSPGEISLDQLPVDATPSLRPESPIGALRPSVRSSESPRTSEYDMLSSHIAQGSYGVMSQWSSDDQ